MINLLNAIAEIINLGVHFIVYIIITAIIILAIIFLALVACRNHRDRNASLDLAKPWLQQKGTWRAAYDDDTAFRQALVQKSANEGRWGVALTVPAVDCTPPESGGR